MSIFRKKKDFSRKFKFHYNLTRMTGTTHEDQYTFFIIPRSVLLRMTNLSDRSRRKNQNTHSGYVILIAFSLQQLLHEDSTMFHYTYIVCLVYPSKNNICQYRDKKYHPQAVNTKRTNRRTWISLPLCNDRC